MSERKHPLAKCEDCPLQEVGRFVPSVGPAKAELAFIGEAPGVQEARNGVPFTGPSGKLLDAVLKHHNIERQEVFLTNACLCRPPDNSTPTPTAIVACRDRLIAELRDREVGTGVLLGNSAAQSMLGLSGVTKLRVGPGRQSKLVPGIRFIPTLHPAAALRQADLFPHIVTDIGKVNAPHVVWDEPKYIVAETVVDALQLLDAVSERGTDRLVVDIEVDVEKDIAFDHPNQYGMLCVGIGYAKGRVLVLAESVLGEQRVRDRLASLLRSRRIGAQNGKFDLAGLYPLLGPLELWFDSMLASYVFDERGGVHGLKIQAVEYLGAPQYDDEIKQYIGPGIGYGAIPRDKLYRYNAIDVACTWDLIEMYEKRFETDPDGVNLRKVHDFLVRASNQLMYVELNGIKVDTAYINQLSEQMIAELDVIEEEIDKIIQYKAYDKKGGINPRSPQQVKKYLADNKIQVDSTNADTIQFLIDKHAEKIGDEVLKFCNALLIHRKQAKLYGTYVKGIRNRLYRGRVYPTFMLHGTTTGRLSCRNPNLQNIPRDSSIRRLFIPSKPEHVFLSTDYSQAELRVLSYLARDNYFRDIFNGGQRDLFDELTPILYPHANKDTMDKASWKELRIRVKAYVYGLSYGRSEFSIASEYSLPVSEAREGMDRFFNVLPEIVAFREQTRNSVLAGNDLVTPWGRHRRYTLITKENVRDVMNEALAFLPQSTASDMCVSALVGVRQETKGFAWIRNIIHDALLVECHRDDVEEVKEIVERHMLQSAEIILGDYVKMAVESTVGESWGDV